MREDRDAKSAIPVDQISKDLFIGDLAVVEIPFEDRRSRLDPEPPMLPDEVPRLLRAEGLCGDLVQCKGDLMVREELPRLDAGGSPLKIVENHLGHTCLPLLIAGSS